MLSALNLVLPGRLAGVNVALDPGQVTAICGPNGAGKSTLLDCLAGLHSGATVMLDGRALSALAPRARAQAIGYLPQDGGIAWDLSVETLAGLGRLPWRTGAVEDGVAIDNALAALGLDGLRQRPVGKLSGGERARALLARVLAGTPRWLLADEPLANLDLMHQLTLLRHFRRLATQSMGVVIVLHDLSQAMNHADRVLVLAGGQLLADDVPEVALTEATIAKAWGIKARWLGEPGQRALVFA